MRQKTSVATALDNIMSISISISCVVYVVEWNLWLGTSRKENISGSSFLISPALTTTYCAGSNIPPHTITENWIFPKSLTIIEGSLIKNYTLWKTNILENYEIAYRVRSSHTEVLFVFARSTVWGELATKKRDRGWIIRRRRASYNNSGLWSTAPLITLFSQTQT